MEDLKHYLLYCEVSVFITANHEKLKITFQISKFELRIETDSLFGILKFIYSIKYCFVRNICFVIFHFLRRQ